jgi:CRISPR/Cas system-associated exonuclease Cas4 (RecB family)
MQSTQLSLFDDTPPEPPSLSERLASIEWSYSKRGMFAQCPLRYYYHYYGASQRMAKSETRKQELHFIKQHVTNRYLLSGKALHLVIKTFSKHAKQDNIWETERLADFAKKVYRDSWNHSREHPFGDWFPDTQYPPLLLKEFYDNVDSAEGLCADEESRLLKAIKAFASDAAFAEFRERGSAPGSLTEESMRLSILDCRVTGKIDLAYRVDDHVTVVDWKIGESDNIGNHSLQLAAYGLWAVEHFNCAVDQLRVCKAFLSSGEITNFHVNDSVLNKARICILQDAERMAFMHEYGRDGIAEAFSPCPYPNVCRMCIYERICYG